MTYVEAAQAPLRKNGQIKLHDSAAFAGMRRACQLVARCLDMLVDEVKPGVPTDRIDQLVFEPNSDDSELFFTNLFSFSSRHRVCQLAYRNTLADLRKRAAVLKPMLAAHDIRYNDDIVNDRHRSILDGLDVTPRMTETTARLRRLDPLQ